MFVLLIEKQENKLYIIRITERLFERKIQFIRNNFNPSAI